MQRALPPEFTAEEACDYWGERYLAPLKILGRLARQGKILRLKRGLYAFADTFEPLAAAPLLHGPSYVSFESALGFYGLIPERVERVISVVDGRSRSYTTAFSVFEYRAQSRCLFAKGMSIQSLGSRRLLIANREKALLDTLAATQLKAASLSPEALWSFVVEGLRFDEQELTKFSLRKLEGMVPLYRNLGPRKFVAALRVRKASSLSLRSRQ